MTPVYGHRHQSLDVSILNLLRSVSDAVLYCEFKTERDQNPRIEWKKKDKEVSFVYFQGNFTGNRLRN